MFFSLSIIFIITMYNVKNHILGSYTLHNQQKKTWNKRSIFYYYCLVFVIVHFRLTFCFYWFKRNYPKEFKETFSNYIQVTNLNPSHRNISPNTSNSISKWDPRKGYSPPPRPRMDGENQKKKYDLFSLVLH